MDLITYTADIAQLRIDIATIANAVIDPDNPHPAKRFCRVDEEGNAQLLLTKIPTVMNGIKSISLIRGVPEQAVEAIPSAEVIGWVENGEFKFKPGGQDKYEAVYDTSDITYIDDSGNTRTYTPPYQIGGFM